MSAATATTSAFTRTGPGWRYRLESIPIRRLRGLGMALLLVAAGGLLGAVNMTASPGRLTDEGILVNRAWTLENVGTLGRLTDWYDHPPLGWLQLSLWTSVTGALDRAPTAVGGGRELMLVVQLVSAGLLWLLARRLGFARWAAAVALVLFALSPLAVHLHRQVSLDNLATPWLVAAFVLACSPRRQLVAFAGSGVCLAVAVLTNETSLVLLPVVVWQLWRTGLPSTIRYGLVVAGSLFVLVCGAYAMAAALQGELLSGSDHAGLLDGVQFQVLDPPSTGSILDAGSVGRDAIALWFDLDPVGLTLMLVAVPVAFVVAPKLRPVASAAALVAVLVAVPGHLGPSLIVGALPFGALLVAGLVQQLGRRAGTPVISLAAVGAVAAAVGLAWTDESQGLLRNDSDAAMRRAERWIVANVPDDYRLIVDDALWVDLVEAGFHPQQVASYHSLALDPDVGPRAPGSWRDYRVVVSTPSLQTFPDPYPQARAAVRRSVPMAAFGSGTNRVEIRAIAAEGSASAAVADDHDPIAAAEFGAALADNPSIRLAPEARRALVAGEVDERLMTTLVALAAARQLEVPEFPLDPGEAGTGAARRVAELRAVTTDDAHALADLLRAQQAPYRPADVDVGPEGALTVTYRPAPLT